MSAFGGLIRAEDGATDEDVDAILKEMEKALPKERKTHAPILYSENNIKKGWNDYRDEMVKLLKEI